MLEKARWLAAFAPRISEALEEGYRSRLQEQARGVRVLVFGLIALTFGLSPLYASFLFAVDESIVLLRVANFSVVLPSALLGLYGAWARMRVDRADLCMLIGGAGVCAGLLANYHLGRLTEFAFPFSWMCFVLSALILAVRVPFRPGALVVAIISLTAIGLEWGLQGNVHEANFNVATVVLFVSITLYAGRTLERTSIDAQEVLQKLRTMAQTDELTGLPNRRAALEKAAEVFRRATRKKRRVAIAIVDIDYFKKINDSYGHVEGDRVLRWVSRALADSCEDADDLAARIGGEEFLLLWSRFTERQHVLDRAEALRLNIVGLSEPGATGSEAPLPSTTVTIGIHEGIPESTACYNDYLARADEALYEGKRMGRNRVAASAAFTPHVVSRDDGSHSDS